MPTLRPDRANAIAVAVPAGPPPTIATSRRSLTAVLAGLDRALILDQSSGPLFLNDEPKLRPILHHALRSRPGARGPGSSLFPPEYLVRPLGGPPVCALLKRAVEEIGLPW